MYLTLCKPTTISKKKKKKKTDVVLRNKSLSAAELAELLVYPRRVDTLFPATLVNQVTSPATQGELCSCTAAGCEWLRSPLTGCTEGLIPGRGHHRFQLWSDQYSTLFPAWQSIRHT